MPQLSVQDQAVTAKPDIKVVKRSKDDEFIVNACDGIWDCLNNQQCGDLVAKKLKTNKQATMSKHIGEMLHEILAKDTETGIGTDNMTATLIKFTD